MRIMDFIRDLLTPRTIWIDKGQGHWVMRRRLHPLTRFLLWLGAAALAFAIGRDYLKGFEVVETARAEASAIPAIRVERTPEPGAGGAMTPGEAMFGEARPETGLLPASLAVPVASGGAAAPDALKSGSGSEKIPAAAKKADKDKYWLRINKSEFTLQLMKGDRVEKTYSVAVGKNPGNKQRVGDNRTPTGDFRVRSIENASSWTHDFKDGKGQIAGAYGPWFIRLDANGWKGIGIHGTHNPASIGTRATEGCIRMHNEELREIRKLAYRNMRVVIQE